MNVDTSSQHLELGSLASFSWDNSISLPEAESDHDDSDDDEHEQAKKKVGALEYF